MLFFSDGHKIYLFKETSNVTFYHYSLKRLNFTVQFKTLLCKTQGKPKPKVYSLFTINANTKRGTDAVLNFQTVSTVSVFIAIYVA